MPKSKYKSATGNRPITGQAGKKSKAKTIKTKVASKRLSKAAAKAYSGSMKVTKRKSMVPRARKK